MVVDTTAVVEDEDDEELVVGSSVVVPTEARLPVPFEQAAKRASTATRPVVAVRGSQVPEGTARTYGFGAPSNPPRTSVRPLSRSPKGSGGGATTGPPP